MAGHPRPSGDGWVESRSEAVQTASFGVGSDEQNPARAGGFLRIVEATGHEWPHLVRSGIARWGGVSMETVMELVKPQPEARWAVFYSLGEGPDSGIYYDAHPIEQMGYQLTMLAYDMNGEPLSFGHGSPLRLRNEVQLGSKQVKWVKGVEFVADFVDIGRGFGGYNQDDEFFGYRQSI